MQISQHVPQRLARLAPPVPLHLGRRKVTIAATPAGSNPYGKMELVERLQQLKEKSGKTYTTLGDEMGLSNVYTAMLLQHQHQLKPQSVEAFKKALPGISASDLKELQKAPSRRWDPEQIQDPTIYRLHEATMLAGEAIKSIINEEFDDGIMSAINFHVNVAKCEGKEGEERVVITMNGKFLPFVEQSIDADVTRQ